MRRIFGLIFVIFWMNGACKKNDQFKSGSDATSPREIPTQPDPKEGNLNPIFNNNPVTPPGFYNPNDPQPNTTPPYQPPQNLVTPPPQAKKTGSFSVWVEPRQPKINVPYYLMIQIDLPTGLQNYNKMDLSGFVVGTDNYRQGIGANRYQVIPPQYGTKAIFDAVVPEKFHYDPVSGKAILAVRVPGARYTPVKETIQIQSNLLNERDEIVFIFSLF